jgi:hypothetical protein
MGGMTTPVHRRTTAAFVVQAWLSFAISLSAMVIGIFYLPVGPWVRGFLALGLLYAVTASLTLAKVVRDQQEVTEVVSRVDQARLDKLLVDHDPFKVPAG